MLRNSLYYSLKPLLPWSVRMSIRRWVAVRKRKKVGAIWPVLPGSEQPPAGWPGWPDGKQFALVLTHDVEGIEGVKKVRKLAELEMRLGFRSSFNFIPEGDYTVPAELRDWLTANGFEFGVHDLRHDGKLYRSHTGFSSDAVRINQHLKDWGAVGFRSGFMLNQLDWLHALNIQYDTSTFDTDPFEPQPNGQNTIFPFWVSNPAFDWKLNRLSAASINPQSTIESRPGYVELPYTLPQDSTLFLLLREPNCRIWLDKLDWVARNRGMALVNVHPDYLRFPGEVSSKRTFPVEFYTEFLQHIRTRHEGQFWQVLAGKLAGWYASSLLGDSCRASEITRPLRLSGKRAAVVLYSYYPSDPRPRREAEALVSAGMEVDLLCLRETAAEATHESINGVNVHRIPLRRRRDSKLTYLLQYGCFIALSAAALARQTLRRRYDLVHVHNMPDVLVFSGLIPKLCGARIILDLHDPMPELMMTIFGLRETSFAVRFLRALEKLSIGFADQVLTVNLACKKIFGARSCRPEKIQVLMNAPDEGIFGFQAALGEVCSDTPRPFVIMYHGSIVERHGLDLAVQALQGIRPAIPDAVLRIYGRRTPFLDSVMQGVQEQGLSDAVQYLGPQSLEEIVKSIEACDVGIIPNRRSIFTEINTPTRIFEYLSRGKPVIAPQAPGITDYFGPDELVFFQLGDAGDLARQLAYVHAQNGRVTAIVKRGQAVYLKHRWSREKLEFLDRVSQLLSSPRQ